MAINSLRNFVKHQFRHYRLRREQLLTPVTCKLTKPGGADRGWMICSDLIPRGLEFGFVNRRLISEQPMAERRAA